MATIIKLYDDPDPNELRLKAEIDQAIISYEDYPIKGITYFDLNPIYKEPMLRMMLTKLCHDVLSSNDTSLKPLWHNSYDYIAVVESRGFLMGSILAEIFRKGLILLRSKPGRLPGETSIVKHTLEYGESQMEVQNGQGTVLIFDDVLATGGTATAAAEVLIKGGYTPVSALFPLELKYCNPDFNLPYQSILKYEE
tara:strand:- start:773 stop:1360 length:588 start_codon:yes stop_codon:yes gene_type:complete